MATGQNRARGSRHGMFKHGHALKHNASPEYVAWHAMIKRCHNPNDRCFHNYGGRGIKVCERWKASFLDFLADVGPRPSSRHSIDRFPDNDGDYEPGNVRWATGAQQACNKRTSRLITHEGKTMTVAAWADSVGISRRCLYSRLDAGWPTAEALTTPSDRSNCWRSRPRRGN